MYYFEEVRASRNGNKKDIWGTVALFTDEAIIGEHGNNKLVDVEKCIIYDELNWDGGLVVNEDRIKDLLTKLNSL